MRCCLPLGEDAAGGGAVVIEQNYPVCGVKWGDILRGTELQLQTEGQPRQIQFSYEDAPTLARFAASDADLRIAMGPFGSGKTSACVMEFVRRTLMQDTQSDGLRHARFIAVRNTYRQLRDTTIRTVFDWLPEIHFGRYVKSDESYIVRNIPGLYFEILFRALDRPEHVQNLLSLEVTGGFINEIREMRWAIVEALFGRLGRYPKKGCLWSGLWADTNPPPRTHWIYQRFERQLPKPPELMELYKQPSGVSAEAENKPHLSDRYYERMLEVMDEDTARVYVHGEYGVIKAGKPVYPGFAESLHVKEGLKWDKRLRLIRGWDFGLTPACVVAQMTALGQVQVLCEMTTERAGIDAFADVVIRECATLFPGAKFTDVADPAGGYGLPITGKEGQRLVTCYSILNGKDIWPIDGDNSLTMRLDAVRYGLKTLGDKGEPLLVIDANNCLMLRDGFAGAYHYREIITTTTVGSKYPDEPEKNEYSHPHDALQYICELVFGFLVRKESKKPRQAYQDPTDPTEGPAWAVGADDDGFDPEHEIQSEQYE